MYKELDLQDTFYIEVAYEQALGNLGLMNLIMKEQNEEKQKNNEKSVGYKTWEDLIDFFDDVAWEIEGSSVNLPREALSKVFRIVTAPIAVVTAVPAVACEIGKITMDTISELVRDAELDKAVTIKGQ